MNEYPTLEAFHADPAPTSLPRATRWLRGGQATPRPEGLCALGEARVRSPESDYGVCWTEGGRNWPRWRVSYLRATGEVCAFEAGGRGHDRVRVLGVVPVDEDHRFDSGGKMDGPTYYDTLDRILDGYADEPTFDLAWVANRLAGYQPSSAARFYAKDRDSGLWHSVIAAAGTRWTSACGLTGQPYAGQPSSLTELANAPSPLCCRAV